MRDYYRDDFGKEMYRDAELAAIEERERRLTEAEKRKTESDMEIRLLSAICFDILGTSPAIQRERIAAAYERYANEDRYPNVRDFVRKALAMKTA